MKFIYYCKVGVRLTLSNFQRHDSILLQWLVMLCSIHAYDISRQVLAMDGKPICILIDQYLWSAQDPSTYEFEESLPQHIRYLHGIRQPKEIMYCISALLLTWLPPSCDIHELFQFSATSITDSPVTEIVEDRRRVEVSLGFAPDHLCVRLILGWVEVSKAFFALIDEEIRNNYNPPNYSLYALPFPRKTPKARNKSMISLRKLEAEDRKHTVLCERHVMIVGRNRIWNWCFN